MPYRYREDISRADVAIEVWADTLEAVFMEAWDAALRVMLPDPASLRLQVQREVSVSAARPDALLYELLERLLYLKDAEALLMRLDRLEVSAHGTGLLAQGEASGEPVDPERHEVGTDIKAVTMHRLAVEQTATGWRATVVLDT